MTTSLAPRGSPWRRCRTSSTAGPGPSPRSAGGGCWRPWRAWATAPTPSPAACAPGAPASWGLVLPDSANPYFAALSHAIEEAAAERGLSGHHRQRRRAPRAGGGAHRGAAAPAGGRPVLDPGRPAPAGRGSGGGPAARRRADGAGRPHPATSSPPGRCGRGVLAAGPVRRGHPGGQPRWAGAGWRRRTCWTWGTGAWPAWPGRRGTATPRPACRDSARPSAGPAWPIPLVAHGDFDYASGAAIAARLVRPAARRSARRGSSAANDAMAIGALGAIAGPGCGCPRTSP